MKRLVAIYDVGQLRYDFIGLLWENCQNISFWDRQEAERAFYTWLVEGLEVMYFIIPDALTSSRLRPDLTQGLVSLDQRFDILSQQLFLHVRVPAFTGNYRCHVRLLNDDLFLIFN